MRVILRKFTAMNHRKQLGRATVALPGLGITIHDCLIYRSPQGLRVQVPGHPELDAEGRPPRGPLNSEDVPYRPTITFDDYEDKISFCHAVIEAVTKANPEQFQ